jgi:hypothetical protein
MTKILSDAEVEVHSSLLGDPDRADPEKKKYDLRRNVGCIY